VNSLRQSKTQRFHRVILVLVIIIRQFYVPTHARVVSEVSAMLCLFHSPRSLAIGNWHAKLGSCYWARVELSGMGKINEQFSGSS